jgi:hypothetical protein
MTPYFPSVLPVRRQLYLRRDSGLWLLLSHALLLIERNVVGRPQCRGYRCKSSTPPRAGPVRLQCRQNIKGRKSQMGERWLGPHRALTFDWFRRLLPWNMGALRAECIRSGVVQGLRVHPLALVKPHPLPYRWTHNLDNNAVKHVTAPLLSNAKKHCSMAPIRAVATG